MSRRPPTHGDVGIFLEDGVGDGTACTGTEVAGWAEEDFLVCVGGSREEPGPFGRTLAVEALSLPVSPGAAKARFKVCG